MSGDIWVVTQMFLQVLRAVSADRSDASERNKQLAQRMRDALANNQPVYRSLKQDTLLYRHFTCPLALMHGFRFTMHCRAQQKHMLIEYLASKGGR